MSTIASSAATYGLIPRQSFANHGSRSTQTCMRWWAMAHLGGTKKSSPPDLPPAVPGRESHSLFRASSASTNFVCCACTSTSRSQPVVFMQCCSRNTSRFSMREFDQAAGAQLTMVRAVGGVAFLQGLPDSIPLDPPHVLHLIQVRMEFIAGCFGDAADHELTAASAACSAAARLDCAERASKYCGAVDKAADVEAVKFSRSFGASCPLNV